jgi:DnaJ domain/PASTA domain
MTGDVPMASGITLYDVLGVAAGASAQTLRRAYAERLRLLHPDLVADAPSSVVAAAARARAATETAWLVLGDHDLRRRYDMKATGGLLDADLPDGDARRSFEAVKDWVAPLPAASRGRVVVPDLRGLFYRPCHAVVTGAGLRLEVVRLTPDPLPVEGLVVAQSPGPGARGRSSSRLTVDLWHPPRSLLRYPTSRLATCAPA